MKWIRPKRQGTIFALHTTAMRPYFLLFLPIFLWSITVSFSQEAQPCGADELRISNLKSMPSVAKAVAKREAELERWTAQYVADKANRGGEPLVYTIPVVFHVIHQYGPENIGDAQLKDGLRVCNETFRKTSADTALIVDAFKPIHTDCGIQFGLATKDPDGNCHSGINRIASSLATTGDHAVKSLVHWDPTRYLNIYIVSNAAGLAGHAVWPSDADTIPEWDGIVLAHSYIGDIGTSDHTRSVAFAHECGHYLNLHHIWGGNNVPDFYYLPVAQAENCGFSDMVDDTPATIGWQSCALSGTSCGNVVDNVQNAMDYSYCNIMFTNGQRDRMHACLNSDIAGRNNLWQQTNLIATGVVPEPAPLCEADFVSDKVAVCPNTDNAIAFTNTSFHGTVDSLQWEFPGGVPSTSSQNNPTVTYSTSGVHDVTLRAYSNGNFYETTKPNYLTVLADNQVGYPFSESFEETVALDGTLWSRASVEAENQWELTTTAASSGTSSVVVDNWDNGTLTRDELFSPPINLVGVSQMKVAFKYAFAGRNATAGSNKLQFMVTRNCETTWSVRLMLAGESLETAEPQSTPFVPTASQWVQEEINIPIQFFEPGFRFKFVFTSGGENRLFIDDINVDINASVAENEAFASLTLYPNPASHQLAVQIAAVAAMQTNLEIVDVVGKTIFHAGSKQLVAGVSTHEIDIAQLSEGMYLLRLNSANGSIARPFVVQK